MDLVLERSALYAHRLSAGESLHLCRHLAGLKEGFSSEAAALGLSEEEIRAEISKPGSKFRPEFADSPESLFGRIREKLSESGIGLLWSEGRTGAVLEFSRALFPLGIGGNALIPLSELSEEERNRLTRRKRDNGGFPFWICARKEFPPTWKASALFEQNASGFRMVTIFPGEYAPKAEPASGFWENHALVELSD